MRWFDVISVGRDSSVRCNQKTLMVTVVGLGTFERFQPVGFDGRWFAIYGLKNNEIAVKESIRVETPRKRRRQQQKQY